MNNEYYTNFLDISEKAIKKNEGPGLFKTSQGKPSQFLDMEETAGRFRTMLQRTIENLDEELARFEKNFSNKNNAVFWASDYQDVFASLKKIFKSQKVRSVRLPNVNASTIFRELGIKYFLREEKIELREDGDVQFFVADMMLADIGALLLLNQSNNSFSRLTNDKTNIFFTTIDRIMCNSNWAEVYQQLATYRSGGNQQEMVFFKSASNCNNYLFIIDNQRTQLLNNKELRQSLTCLQCGRCQDVCPVLQTIGEEPYNNVFTGPIAHITLPYLESMESYKHIIYACLLCGRCEEVCPISLPIRDMIVDSRHILFVNGEVEKKERHLLATQRKVLLSRSKMNASKFVKNVMMGKYFTSEFKKTRRLPAFNTDTFNKMYQKFKNSQ